MSAAPGIEVDAAAPRRLRNLRHERVRARKQIMRAILADFRAGMAIADIAERHFLKPTAIYGVIHRAGLKVLHGKIPISHLPADRQRLYFKLRRAGLDKDEARRAAVQGMTT